VEVEDGTKSSYSLEVGSIVGQIEIAAIIRKHAPGLETEDPR
jgi:hypothetical protein